MPSRLSPPLRRSSTCSPAADGGRTILVRTGSDIAMSAAATGEVGPGPLPHSPPDRSVEVLLRKQGCGILDVLESPPCRPTRIRGLFWFWISQEHRLSYFQVLGNREGGRINYIGRGPSGGFRGRGPGHAGLRVMASPEPPHSPGRASRDLRFRARRGGSRGIGCPRLPHAHDPARLGGRVW